MDSNWTATQGAAATGSTSGAGPDPNANPDWRSQLQQDARQRIVNKIMDTLKRHLPVSVPEGFSELQKIAVRFEEKIYSAATSQPDYLRKISLKMLSMETKTQPGSFPNQNRIDPGTGMVSQQPAVNPGQSLTMPQAMNQAPAARQQQQQPLLQGSPNMPTAVPGGPGGGVIPSMSGPSISNSNPMSAPGGPSGPGGPTSAITTDMYPNAQRRQQISSQNPMIYQQQLALRHKLQQQQSLLQQTQTQMSPALTGGSGMMSSAPSGGMQQSQLNSVQQQSVGQGGSFQQQPLMRQPQQQPQPSIPMQQTHNMTDLQQQQRLQMQQNQMQQSQMQQNQMQQSQLQQNQLQPNQLQSNQMLNQQMVLGQQQNHLLGSGGAGSMSSMQRQIMQRQAGLLQQQQQQQQQQPQQQQHLLSQFQSQQQQMPQQQLQQQQQQQQPNMMQQREMQMQQQRMQGSPVLLQTQSNSAIDQHRQQQQQFMQQPPQQQRVLQDVASSPASMDSTAQTGHSGDIEEMYQKIKYLKDTYYQDLKEIHQKLSMKLSHLDSIVLPNARGGEQIEKMKNFKTVLERMMAVLQLGKNNMHISLKDKIPLYEKQILNILHNHKKAPQQQPPAGGPSDQPHFPPLQQQQPTFQSQQPSQQQQAQQMDNHPNQLQQQLNTSSMPQSNNLGIPNATQQVMQNALQSDQLQASGTGFGTLQQGTVVPTMQNAMNPPQMLGSGTGIGSTNMSHTGTMAGMPTNMNSAQVLKQQQQHQDQQILPQQRMMPTQQQQMQQRQLQQRMMQQKQQHLLQQQQQHPLQQQKQQHQQQPQQTQAPQLGQPSDLTDMKSRQGAAGMKPGAMYQQNYPGMGPRNSYYHSQLKPGSNLPISSPQNIQSSSPQISHPSPQVDQQGFVPPSQLKNGTPLQAAASPFVPSPSPPVAPSPMLEDTKLGAMHNSAAGQSGQPLPANSAQAGQMGQPQAGSLAVGTPGMSASPLLAEFTSPEAGQGTNLSTQAPETEKPIEKLARLMRTMPHKHLSAAVKDIASVVSMVDRIAGSAPGNGSRSAIGDDLVAMTKCRLQAKNLVHPDGGAGTSTGASPPTKKMKRDTSAMPLNSKSDDGMSPDSGSVTDNFKASGPDASEMQSTATSSTKGLKSEIHHALLEEISQINFRLIDTELTLNEEDADSMAEAGESILVKCTYKAIALSPGLRAHFTSSQLSPILPLRLLVPSGYPKCSPVILDKLLDEQRDLDDFSTRARSKFNISIRGLSQPMSLEEIAHAWDTCARKVIQEYAAQFGGGSFSSRMITWQTVNPGDPYVIV